MEKVYVEKPWDIENFYFSDHVFKFIKAFYDLKQAPSACYDRIKSFLIDNDFNIDKIDITFITKKR